MKKIFVVILSISVFLFSCEKESLSPASNQSNTNYSQLKAGVNPEEIGCQPYVTDWCEDCHEYCNNPGLNCAPCVVITPPSQPGGGGIKGGNNLEDLSDLLDNDPEEIALFFNDKSNYEDLFPALHETDFLVKLKSGNYFLSEIFVQKKSNNRVFVFTNNSDNSTIALPYVVQ